MSQECTTELTGGQEADIKGDHSQQGCMNMRAIMEINEVLISYTYRDVTIIYSSSVFFPYRKSSVTHPVKSSSLRVFLESLRTIQAGETEMWYNRIAEVFYC